MVEITAPATASATNSRSSAWRRIGGTIVLAVVLLALVVAFNTRQQQNNMGGTNEPPEPTNDDNDKKNDKPGTVSNVEPVNKIITHKGVGDGRVKQKKDYKHMQGTTRLDNGKVIKGTIDGVDYYHCLAEDEFHDLDIHDIILLHGAKYTASDWRTSKILVTLCETPHVQVTALNLNSSATYPALEKALYGLVTHRVLSKLPVQALVTPSASGRTVVSAIQDDRADLLHRLTAWWVPIASPAVMELSAMQLAQFQKAHLRGKMQIFAMYGDQDEKGMQVAKKLQVEAGASVQEFQGEHAFYLNAPKEFSAALVKKLGDVQIRRLLAHLWRRLSTLLDR